MDTISTYTAYYKKHCEEMQEKNRYRKLYDKSKDSDYIDFSTNDYLNISKNISCIDAGYKVAKEYGLGSTGSRLLSGNYPLCSVFEKQIAQDKNTEAALLFATGYQANISVLSQILNSSILQQEAIVFFDKNNHSSLYQALFLSGTKYIRYPHNNIVFLEKQIKKYKKYNKPAFLVIESIYGMDGDVAPLAEYISLCKQYDIFLYVDEAHATGVFGKNGYGLTTDYDLKDIDHCIMGTFSKGLGGMGAYIASSTILIEYLINTCTGFIYSTSPAPFIIGAMHRAWQEIANLAKEREHIHSLAEYTRYELKRHGYNTSSSNSHIIPIIIGDEIKTYEIYSRLMKNNIMTSFIRPPTVPPKTSRLRLAITTKHTQNHIQKLLEILTL